MLKSVLVPLPINPCRAERGAHALDAVFPHGLTSDFSIRLLYDPFSRVTTFSRCHHQRLWHAHAMQSKNAPPVRVRDGWPRVVMDLPALISTHADRKSV